MFQRSLYVREKAIPVGRGTEKEQRQRRGGSPVAGLGTASAPATRHEPFQGPSRQPRCEFCAAQSHRAGQGRGQIYAQGPQPRVL